MDKKLKNELFRVAVDYLFREKKVGSQKELAEKIGITEPSLSRVMNGGRTVSDMTADMAKLIMTPSVWYYGLDVLTGEGCNPRQQAREVSIPSSYIGTSGKLPATFFGLSPWEAWQTDVAVALCKSDGTSLGSVTVEGVRMQQNVTSVYSGGVTGRGGIMSVSADDAWGEDDVHEW